MHFSSMNVIILKSSTVDESYCNDFGCVCTLLVDLPQKTMRLPGRGNNSEATGMGSGNNDTNPLETGAALHM